MIDTKDNIKINTILYDNIYRVYIYSIDSIESENEVVRLPEKRYFHVPAEESFDITHIGFKIKPDTRSEDERWEDEYRFYVPQTNSIMGKEVYVSSNIKKIIIPATIKCISKEAFENVSGLTFEVEQDNEYFEVVGGLLINKKTKEIIYGK